MSDSADRLKSPVKTGDVVGGKYRVEKVLGAGGMGVVLAATHVDLDQKVALKFILPQALAGKGNVERFLREARAVVRLKSEHVAKVFDVGREVIGEEERPYMVLELLEGMDLSKLNKQKGPLPVADAVEYVLQACEALVEAHALGIVHRDLKPQNLFVTRRLNGTPLVKVLDFGISKAVGPSAEGQMSLTDSSAVIGSPLYMAPEQMRSARSAEIRSDIWALGVILYELLGGQLPFDGETVTEVCIRVVNESPPELMKLRPGLDEKLVAIVMRCLEKDVEARFHNVASLATALEPYSRSAQGGLVRPWRSFEDTQDSQEVRSPGGVLLSTPADATGPATAVTMDSLSPEALEAMSEDERSARAKAGSTKASPGMKPTSARDPDKHPLVSTDVTWGDSTGKQPKKTRSFATGLAAGAFVSLLAAAGIVGVLLGRSAGPAPKSAAGGDNAAATATAAAPATTAATAPAPATASAPATAAATATESPAKAPETKSASKTTHAHPLPPMATASGAAGRILGPKGTAAAAARTSEPAAAAPAATTSQPPETKTDPAAPNGAPILR